MNELEICPARKEELKDVLELYSILENDPADRLSLPEAEQLFDRMHMYPNFTLYVALLDGRIAGAFALLIMDNLAHHGAPSGVVEDVAVHKDLQGQGIGRKMMEFAMRCCREAGCYKLALSSNLKRTDAHRFYENLGFEKHGYSFRILFGEE